MWKVNWTDDTHYLHTNAAEWMGKWDDAANSVEHLNYDNIAWTLKNSEKLLQRWGNHSAMAAF
jgi:hypothetical protein